MSVLFGGNLAEELAETVRSVKEEFDSIDNQSVLERNQWKNKSAEIIRTQQIETQNKFPFSKPSPNDEYIDIDTFVNESDDDSADSDSDGKQKRFNPNSNNGDAIEFLDVRQQTIFRPSKRARISKYDKKKNAKISSLSYIQDNNVRTSYKNGNKNKTMPTNEDETYTKENPFMDQKLLRQNFVIDRRRKDHSMIKDKSRINKLARKNMSFLKEVMRSEGDAIKKNLLIDQRHFNRKLRFSLGAPNKRRQRNYAEFQNTMRNRQNAFDKKKDIYLERGLRVQNKLNDKVLFAKHGRKKIWNAGRTKKQSKKSRPGKVGSYEFAKNVNEW